jgi:hypothetical protein
MDSIEQQSIDAANDIDLKWLRSFVVVVEELYFGQVAARLRMTQPSLSRQIMLVGGEVTLLDHEVVG